MPKYLLILVKYARKILKSTRRSCKYLAIQNHLIHLAWDETISAATPLHCLSMGLLSNCQNLQKVGHDIVIFNGNVLGHAWHTWCKKGTNRKRMSCSSPICHMQIFKSFDFRTMGLWIWITFILIRTVQSLCWYLNENLTNYWNNVLDKISSAFIDNVEFFLMHF